MLAGGVDGGRLSSGFNPCCEVDRMYSASERRQAVFGFRWVRAVWLPPYTCFMTADHVCCPENFAPDFQLHLD